jgi:hypothetical protein
LLGKSIIKRTHAQFCNECSKARTKLVEHDRPPKRINTLVKAQEKKKATWETSAEATNFTADSTMVGENTATGEVPADEQVGSSTSLYP